MVVSLNTNVSAIAAQRRLGESTAQLTKSFERLSSGLRINRAGDDAAGLAISESLRADSRVYAQGVRNLSDGVSITNIAESTLNEMSNIVTRLQELAEQAANGTLSNKQRASMDSEAQALSKEYFRVSRVAEFNGLRLFDGSVQGGFRFQAGYGDNGGLTSALGGKLGDGTVTASATYLDASAFTREVALADLNNDGIIDILSADDAFVGVRLGVGDGTFGTRLSYVMETTTIEDLAAEDVNGDGILDLLSAGASGAAGTAHVRLGLGDGTFGAAASYAAETTYTRGLTLGDVNGDGTLDLVTAGNIAYGGYATIRIGRGDGTFGTALSYTTETKGSYEVELGDLNGDGHLDLITAGWAAGNLGYATARLGNGDGSFGTATSFATEGALSLGLALGDINGDGILDLATAGRIGSYAGWSTVRLGTGTGSFRAATSYATEEASSTSIALADMNGDGALDLLTTGWASSSGIDAYLTTRLGTGDGQFAAAVSTRVFATSTLDDRGWALTTGDINADGVRDVIVGGRARLGGDQSAFQVMVGNTRDGVAPLLSFSLGTKADALQAIPMLQQTLSRVSSQRGTVGAMQSRLGTAVANLQVARENFDSARSQITDVDVASESATLLKTQIIQQAASAILSQANSAPQLALRLLSG